MYLKAYNYTVLSYNDILRLNFLYTFFFSFFFIFFPFFFFFIRPFRFMTMPIAIVFFGRRRDLKSWDFLLFRKETRVQTSTPGVGPKGRKRRERYGIGRRHWPVSRGIATLREIVFFSLFSFFFCTQKSNPMAVRPLPVIKINDYILATPLCSRTINYHDHCFLWTWSVGI